jgi:hypothetical protein
MLAIKLKSQVDNNLNYEVKIVNRKLIMKYRHSKKTNLNKKF